METRDIFFLFGAMIGQIKSINFPFYSVGSQIIHIETNKSLKFSSKIVRINGNVIFFTEYVVFGTKEGIFKLEFGEFVLDFNTKSALVATRKFEFDELVLLNLEELIFKLAANPDALQVFKIKDWNGARFLIS